MFCAVNHHHYTYTWNVYVCIEGGEGQGLVGSE